jgi:hypothetical protein
MCSQQTCSRSHTATITKPYGYNNPELLLNPKQACAKKGKNTYGEVFLIIKETMKSHDLSEENIYKHLWNIYPFTDARQNPYSSCYGVVYGVGMGKKNTKHSERESVSVRA